MQKGMVQIIKQKILVNLVLLLVFTCWSSASADEGVQLMDLSVHYKIPSNHPDIAQLGTYPKLERYNLHDDAAPQSIDVVVNIAGNMSFDILLDVVPVVGQTNWLAQEGITDFKLLEATKQAFPSVMHVERKEVVEGTKTIVFQDLDLDALISRFREINLWPRELIFRVGIVPHTPEKNISDNILSLTITLDPPD